MGDLPNAVEALKAAAWEADAAGHDRLRLLAASALAYVMGQEQRHPKEAAPYVEKFGSELWVALEYSQVRARYGELPSGKTFIILCNAGTRSYEIQVFLDHVGTTDTMVLSGGLNVISRLGVDWLI